MPHGTPDEETTDHPQISKVLTSATQSPDFIPPKEVTFPPYLLNVPLNLHGPTEIPQKTVLDYSRPDIAYKWKEYLPHKTLTLELPLSPYEHVDSASRADPEKKSLFAILNERKDLTPCIGTEVLGVQLSQLSDSQKNELALYVAERGVVIFRKQNFVHQGALWLKEYGSYFGRLHVHQWAVHVKDHPELDVVFRDNDSSYWSSTSTGTLNTTKWHSDMTYELNPPGTTFLCSLTVPKCGGDTLYLSTMEAFDRLSPIMQRFLEGLQALHVGINQYTIPSATNFVRRPPIDTVHPVVRRHPVTGRKALWVNPKYVTKILGLRKEESDNLLTFLFDHMQKGLDFHTRVKWEEDTVAVYDNRVVQHSALLDYPLEPRHLIRVTPQAERVSF